MSRIDLIFLIYNFIIYCEAQVNWQGLGLFKRKQGALAIDGSWSSWQEWGDCYLNEMDSDDHYKPWEGFILRSRNRLCNSPAPLYGGRECSPPSRRYKQCSCTNPLIGRSSNRSQFSSSSKSLSSNPPGQGKIGDNFVGWCANKKLNLFDDTYFQVKFDNFVNVSSITTQGIKRGRITRYKLKYSLDGEDWEFVDQARDIYYGNLRPNKVQTNKFSTYKTIRYLRLYPTKVYGLPCLKMELHGCVFTCGDVLTKSLGNIVARSSNEKDQNCLWKIQVKETTSLTFDFIVFYVLCKDGYLDFYDGEYPFNHAPLLVRKCLYDENYEIPLLKLNKNSVWLNFVSNSSSPEVGFNIKYFSECNQVIDLIEDQPFTIKSPNYPNSYPDNLNCTWEISAPGSEPKIDLIVDEFKVSENSDSSKELCQQNGLIIEQLSEGKREIFDKFCMTRPLVGNFTFETKKLFITIESNSYATIKAFSFKVIARKIHIPTTATPNDDDINNRSKLSSSYVNNNQANSNGTVFGKKIKKESDDTWTVIIISAFSAFFVILLIAVIYLNLKRFLENRNDVNAHCAKLIQEQNNSKSKTQEKNFKLEQIKIQQGKFISDIQNDNAAETDQILPSKNDTIKKEESIERDTKEITRKSMSIRSLERQESATIDSNETFPDIVDEKVEDDESFNFSNPQIHSPLKTGSASSLCDDNKSINV